MRVNIAPMVACFVAIPFFILSFYIFIECLIRPRWRKYMWINSQASNRSLRPLENIIIFQTSPCQNQTNEYSSLPHATSVKRFVPHFPTEILTWSWFMQKKTWKLKSALCVGKDLLENVIWRSTLKHVGNQKHPSIQILTSNVSFVVGVSRNKKISRGTK